MPKNRFPEFSAIVEPYEEKINALEDRLREARYTILNLVPKEAQEALKSYLSCESRQETYGWLDRTAETIVSLAQILAPEKGSYFSDRAYCPLCGGESTSPYERGFAVPEGLRRHLVGWGNTRPCAVLEAAFALAKEYWHEKFHAEEQIEKAQEEERRRQRKASEVLYRIAPDREPELIDEGFIFGGTFRNESELAWAEQRLAYLGFQITCEDNVKSYTSEMENWVIYADPRVNGKIEFRAYKKPLPKKARGPHVRTGISGYFYLMDSWKHDLRKKYESRLLKAIR
ncbi:hypothetical protein [Methylocaldum szegediense]|jgi:hypothetical protein|uniref:Uncharacterized protein n=1 Tax=Methylocaldum szegediense TaxID=73780 RepID=A0ABN8X1X4_9GAMM|nr:hypothetical protein [Methylocaldum szegediense]CAI8823485.1 conserved protein of unknown function [Methylocaldum szegediense]